MSLLIIPYFYAEISEKMTVGNSSSATIRYRDFYIGLNCLSEHPILGVKFDNLSQSRDILKYELDAIYNELDRMSWFDYHESLAGGYTNGLFYLFMIWGIVGFFFYYSFFRCKLWNQCVPVYPIFIPIIIALSAISEPISNTSFIYLFCLYNFFVSDSYIRKRRFL